MSEPFSIVSQDEVSRLLRIAERHLAYITRSRTQRITVPGLKPDHAIVASIFSAAAVEAGLNLFISVPVLFIKDQKLRRFLGVLATKYSRLSVQQKIEFAREFCPEIRKDKALLKRVRVLFAYRNSVLHSSPEYIDPLGLGDIGWQELATEISKAGLVPHPGLSSRGPSSSEVGEAFQHYQTALDFLSKLTVYSKESESSTSASSA